MTSGHSIPPFPADTDRDSFGHWLSGFTDGEGHFGLRFKPHHYKGRISTTPSAIFQILLRSDDEAILRLIQSFFGCGFLVWTHRGGAPSAPARARDQSTLRINRTADLLRTVVPHFIRHPLRAKKAKDFVIWREGVRLLHEARSQPRGGSARRWTDTRLVEFQSLATALQAVREFNAPAIIPPRPVPHPSLFDGLTD